MDLVSKKLEIIRLVLALETEGVLDYTLTYLQENRELEENYTPKSETDKLLADYEQKVAGLETNEEMDEVLSQYTDEQKLTITLLLRAKDARENRHLAVDAREFFANRRKQRKSHVENL